MSSNGTYAQEEQYPVTNTQSTNGSANGNSDISKDEIGWFFVSQFYNTMSKSPEKLHLFYNNKRSQFVSGTEAEVSQVSIGRDQIQEAIRKLDFQDCKVRVTNVDSQGSDETIVIQVIGEISDKKAVLKKFVQTFVLAKQPSGYFVLNDIFRYIKEDDEEEVSPPSAEVEPTVESGARPDAVQEAEPVHKEAEQPAAPPLDADIVDEKLQETLKSEPELAASANGADEAPVERVQTEAPTDPIHVGEAPTPDVAAQEVEQEIITKVESPKDPLPTPAPPTRSASSTSAAKPVVPAVPAVPMSWAARASAAAAKSAPTAKPAVPQPQAKQPSPAVTQARATQNVAPAVAAPPQPTASPAAGATSSKEVEAPKSEGWQSVGGEPKRQARPQSVSQTPQEKDLGNLGYLRYVTENVSEADLKAVLNKFGEVVYFDVNRQKNCAFVEFKDAAGYDAAHAANPHSVNGQNIYIEARKPKSSAFGPGFNNQRGGMINRGRGGFSQNNQRGRGDFGPNRGRGGGAPRGRGAATASTAA